MGSYSYCECLTCHIPLWHRFELKLIVDVVYICYFLTLWFCLFSYLHCQCVAPIYDFVCFQIYTFYYYQCMGPICDSACFQIRMRLLMDFVCFQICAVITWNLSVMLPVFRSALSVHAVYLWLCLFSDPHAAADGLCLCLGSECAAGGASWYWEDSHHQWLHRDSE